MATTRTKRVLLSRSNDVDRLASKLGSRLKISDVPNKGSGTQARKGTSSKAISTPEESKVAAMKSVNTVLQSLASLPAGKGISSRSTVSSTVASGRAALNILRNLNPGLIDTERAALSMVGKLLAHNAYETSATILSEIQRHLPTFYDHEVTPTSLQAPISLLHLPLPISSLDPPIQACVQTYFSHAFSVCAQTVSTRADCFEAYCDALDGPSSLHSWVRFLTAVPPKSLDGLFRRAYIALTTSFASPPNPQLNVLKIRFYALRILLLSNELDLTPFWEQCIKYATSYARNMDGNEEEDKKIMALLTCFANIANAADGRREGKGWLAFCEYWLALARRVRLIVKIDFLNCANSPVKAKDMRSLNLITEYISSAASSSSDTSHSITRACATLTKVAALLDQNGDIDEQRLSTMTDGAISDLRTVQSQPTDAIRDGKLLRVVERCRRACLKTLSRPESGASERGCIIRLIDAFVTFLEHMSVVLTTGAERTDAVVSSLDTLFQLATSVFDCRRAETCDTAYDYLIRGLQLTERTLPHASKDKRPAANYLRCLSGAFANLAGSLYKEERHGIAIRFLTQACPLSSRATEYFSESSPVDTTAGSEKDQGAWSTHRTQVYRRWELLGVCYAKTGDRRLAFDAFVQGVVTYPFENEDPSWDFELPPSLANAVDRLTHLAVVDLRLAPAEASLLVPLRASGVLPSILGSILLRQACSLPERSKPLVRAAVTHFLAEALDVYDTVRFPLRRTQTLALVLEHSYYGSEKDSDMDGLRIQDMIRGTEKLLSEKAKVGEDGAFVHLRRYYRVKISLWAVLHAHRIGESAEAVTRHAQNALDAMKTLTVEPVGTTSTKERAADRSRKTTATRVRARSKSSTAQRNAGAAANQSTRSNTARRSPKTPYDANDTAIRTSPSPHNAKHELTASERTSLAELIIMVAELSHITGFTLERLQLLGYLRLLFEKAGETTSESFLFISSLIAYDLLRLGKLTLASKILAPIAEELCEAKPIPSAVLILLRYAEVLAISGEIPESITMYEKAHQLCMDLPAEDDGRGVSTLSRIRARAVLLERVAAASSVFAVILEAKNEPENSLKSLLQSLRLLNRATETLARLHPSQKPDNLSDPFAMSEVKTALPDTVNIEDKKLTAVRLPQPQVQLDALEWRIANALLQTQLALVHSYALRGSVRESEYFEQQAEEFARTLGGSAMTARALIQKAELQLTMGSLDDVQKSFEEAKHLLEDRTDLEKVDLHRAVGDHLILHAKESDADSEFTQAVNLLAETKQTFEAVDEIALRTAKSDAEKIFAPVLQAKILRQQVWLLRDTIGETYEQLLEELYALPQLAHVEVHVNPFLGRLALYDIHERFRAEMSLGSLAESTIALPMGMTCEKSLLQAPPQDIVDALQQADEHYISDLSRFSGRGFVYDVRATAIAAARISIYEASLGIAFEDSPAFASRLLGKFLSELIDAIPYKFPDPMNQDDMRWPSESPTTSRRRCANPKGRGIFDDLSDEDDEESVDDNRLRQYWDYVLKRHKSAEFIQSGCSTSDIDALPSNWMVITISLTDDKGALLISRQRPHYKPMVFCVPLKGRHEDDEDGHFTFEDAMTELKDIIRLKDEGVKGVTQIKSDDKEAKIAWWESRRELDQRMKDFVENIEFCWLGAFKTILSQPTRIPPDAITSFRTRLEKVFKGILGSHEKKSKKAKLRLETSLLELFAALPPTCKDEELQDLVYFVLDLYHFHGLPVALAEIDMDVVVVDLRSALEEFHAKNGKYVSPEEDAHTFLVLDKNLQAIPWESIPVLRGRNVSRVPSVAFILDRLALARSQRGLPLDSSENSDDEEDEKIDRIQVNPSKGYYVLNPSGDLAGTEGRFRSWAKDLRKVGWDGIIGQIPSEQQFLNALSRKDLVVYFGHGGAEQYARSHKIRHLQRCAATMLWGCSSGALHDMGEFDRIGTPNNYMLAGCPSLVANLWDVTDRDIDKFAQSVFNKLRLDPSGVKAWKEGERGGQNGKMMSVVAAVAQSRDMCKLKYLTGAAVVVYGIPYYL
ncbi:uncharacterized protein FOMMEDRAFT_171563 [Fomitiporia mediterranea MF3/22]|uniref:separase n=1 Tax=Fomitiporia mediterranea (strain MF3/22) TaxID=694068 RepID=R7SFX1_FOMME|nr:uncharacterized protein FOMMEDRAFT_171563 [Fomitiporia mediterranea MF3/22]EJC97616.1 hypothetical protein FOMMEDRAFT_171563 [Fomitiporia mediterranea MF3/22]